MEFAIHVLNGFVNYQKISDHIELELITNHVLKQFKRFREFKNGMGYSKNISIPST